VLISRTRHRNRGRRRWANDSQAGGPDLDVAGLELLIPHRIGTSYDFAFDEHDRLLAQTGSSRATLRIAVTRIERHLYNARAITQVYEGDAAEVARSMHPTTKANSSPRVAQPKHPAKVSPMDSRQLLSGCHRA